MNIAHSNRSANATSGVRRLGRPPGTASADADTVDLSRLFWFFRRRFWLLALVTLLGIALGVAYAFTAQPKYTAAAGLLIDSSAANLSRVDQGGSPAAEDLIAIETQMQIIRSQRVAVAVVDELDLTNNPLFIPNSTDAISAIIGGTRDFIRDSVTGIATMFDESAATGDGGDDLTIDPGMDDRQRAALMVRQQTSVRRIGASRALEVSYTGNHPQIAAQIANALTTAYVQDRLTSQFEATENAAEWLRERIAELQDRSSETARRVQQFRAEHNIVDSGGGRGLVTQEQLAAVNQRMVTAADDTAVERARYEAIQRAIATEGWDTDLTDTGGNQLIDSMRADLIAVQNRIEELQARLDPSAPAILIAMEERARLTEAIRQEMRRVAERLRAQYEVAVEREQDLRREFVRLVEEANTTSEAQVQLRQLESDAEVLEAAYASYLTRYTEVIQQQSAPFLQARIITPATVPTAPSQPRKSIILVLSAILGGGLGMALAIGVEGFDRTVRLPRQLERIGLASLGIIPRVRERNAKLGDWEGKSGRFNAPGIWSNLQGLWPASQPSATSIYDRARIANELRFAADAPNSAFGNSLRRTKTELHLALAADKGSVIGVTSLSRGEGTTTIASNLAHLFAVSGKKTLLMDGNTHHPTISQCTNPEEADALSPGARNFQSMDIDELLARLRDPSDNDPEFAPSASDLFGTRKMSQLLDDSRGRFDCTIVDLPAIESVPDVLAAAPHLDMLLIVVEWGRTPAEALKDATDTLRRHGAPIVGAVLNKVDMRQIRFRGHREADGGYESA
jgi:succinoglycan biosynthesis transport protein ExoP